LHESYETRSKSVMQTVEQFIDALGGTIAVATALDLPPTTVSSWKSSGSIPKWRMEGLTRLAGEKRIAIPAFSRVA